MTIVADKIADVVIADCLECETLMLVQCNTNGGGVLLAYPMHYSDAVAVAKIA